MDAPEFPDILPPGSHISVPFPVNNHPSWTTYPYAGVDIPDTFDSLIVPYLPNARLEPALYAAAVDTIRMTNRYFELVGQYRGTDKPLTEKLVRQKDREWRYEMRRAENGTYEAVFPPNLFPRPPDLRTLFVKEAMGDPTNDKLNALWIRACKDLHIMSDETRERYLGYTREELVKKAELRYDDSWLILEIFKRYLVWWDHVLEQPENLQPTRAEMEAFFAEEEVRRNGATLVDICHAYPYARDVQMLVYRIERFATLEPQASVKTATGADDPVESRYKRNAVPSEDELATVITHLFPNKNSSISFPELLQYWPNSGSQQFIADFLVASARPDATTGQFILTSHDGPGTDEIYAVMEDALNGYTLRDIARRFPNRVWLLDQLRENMAGIAYFDADEQRYFPLYEQIEDVAPGEEWQFMTAGESMAYRNRMRIAATWDPEAIDQGYTWELDAQRYVKRPEPLQLSEIVQVETTPYEPPSPTEVDTTIGGSPRYEPPSPTEVATSFGGSPPPLPLNTPILSGVNAAMQITPMAPPPSPPVAIAAVPSGTTTPPGSPPQGAEPTAETRNSRPPKRAAVDSPEPSKGSKKARTVRGNAKIRCSQNTQKGTRCKKSKERVEGETQWDCGVHKRA
ncbi:hypothetical protein N0V95_000624 [Ascochyta clinopodiicola]|nr:hypothetical protein N0V95_000624 [Ascochyta clinopodiicola]